MRRYLALALGRLGDRRAVPALLQAAKDSAANGPHADPETQIYSVWALGAIGDPQAEPALAELARSEDPGVRKAAVHALGSLPGEDVARRAGAARSPTGVEDVRWNAAVALARRRDPASVPVLLEMLDRAHLDAVAGMNEEQRVGDAAAGGRGGGRRARPAPARAARGAARSRPEPQGARSSARRARRRPPQASLRVDGGGARCLDTTSSEGMIARASGRSAEAVHPRHARSLDG